MLMYYAFIGTETVLLAASNIPLRRANNLLLNFSQIYSFGKSTKKSAK